MKTDRNSTHVSRGGSWAHTGKRRSRCHSRARYSHNALGFRIATTKRHLQREIVNRILRGGNWYGSEAYCATNFQNHLAPTFSYITISFRLGKKG